VGRELEKPLLSPESRSQCSEAETQNGGLAKEPKLRDIATQTSEASTPCKDLPEARYDLAVFSKSMRARSTLIAFVCTADPGGQGHGSDRG
jgi:hypothetical protein